MGIALNPSFVTPETLEHCLRELEGFTAFSGEQVLELASQSKTLAEAQAHGAGLAKSLYFLALYHDAHDQVDACLALTLQAFELQAHLDVSYQIKVLNLLARTYFFSGQNHATLLHAGKALALNSLEDSGTAAVSHLYLARAYLELGTYELAIEHFQEWRTRSQTSGEEILSTTFFAMATLYRRMENYDDALPYYLNSLALARQASDSYLEANTLSSLAELTFVQKDYDEALAYALQSVTLFGHLENTHDLKDAWTILADIYKAKGQSDRALKFYQKGLDYLQQFSDAGGAAELNVRVGDLYLAQHDLDNARPYFGAALVAAQTTDSLETLSNTHKALGMFYEGTNELRLALEHYKKYFAAQEKILQEAGSSRTKAMLIKFEVERLRQEHESQRLKTLELASLVNQLEELSSRDALTGLYNRRFFDDYLQRQLEEAVTTENPLCLVLADVDNFKTINDTFSHAVGDEVLKVIASIFLNTLRGSDCVARYGGEEVIVLFTDTALNKALLVCEKIRQKIESYPWEQLRPSLKVTISMGLSDSYSVGHKSFLEDADAKLYRAKRQGKNKINR
jgi:diguanylate cyclase (GGDEF)-like protein